jgi:hypothetical protein
MSHGILAPTDKDFEVLRTSSSHKLQRLLIGFSLAGLCLYGVFLAGVFAWGLRHHSGQEFSLNYSRLLALQHGWSDTAASDWSRYRSWLIAHGTESEKFVFDVTTSAIASSILSSNSSGFSMASMGVGSRILIGIHLLSIKALFMLLAGYRFIVAVALVSLLSGARSLRIRNKAWLLGSTGNGRLFYSGARASLEKVNDDGSPSLSVQGLACPKQSKLSDVENSRLGKLLAELGVANATNMQLASIIHHYKQLPAYIYDSDQSSDSTTNGQLLENAHNVTREVWLAKQHLVSGGPLEDENPLARCLVRTADQDSKLALQSIPVEELITLALSLEAAKVFTHSFEGERWGKRSSLPHLSARAILHSLSCYPEDYSNVSRTRLRQGLIYALRYSPFSEVRVPINMRDDCWALRQWAEVLLSNPLNRSVVSDEVELYGLFRVIHSRWCRQLPELINNFCASGAIRTGTNLVFVPLAAIITELQKLLAVSERNQLQSTCKRVAENQKKKMDALSEEDSDEAHMQNFKLVKFFDCAMEVNSVAHTFSLEEDIVSEWMSIRFVLSSYGWLASRIGEYGVPSTSVISAVFRPVPIENGGNEHARLGVKGVVALRQSRFSEILGDKWKSKMRFIERATMAESQQLYDRLLKGESREAIEGFDDASTITDSRAGGKNHG